MEYNKNWDRNMNSKLSVWPSKVSIWLNWYYCLCPVHVCCNLHPWLHATLCGTKEALTVNKISMLLSRVSFHRTHLTWYKASSWPSCPFYRCSSEYWYWYLFTRPYQEFSVMSFAELPDDPFTGIHIALFYWAREHWFTVYITLHFRAPEH